MEGDHLQLTFKFARNWRDFGFFYERGVSSRPLAFLLQLQCAAHERATVRFQQNKRQLVTHHQEKNSILYGLWVKDQFIFPEGKAITRRICSIKINRHKKKKGKTMKELL